MAVRSWLLRPSNLDSGIEEEGLSLLFFRFTLPFAGKLEFVGLFVGRGHDPADRVAPFALVLFNETTHKSVAIGGVMTPPYERIVRQISIFLLLAPIFVFRFPYSTFLLTFFSCLL